MKIYSGIFFHVGPGQHAKVKGKWSAAEYFPHSLSQKISDDFVDQQENGTSSEVSTRAHPCEIASESIDSIPTNPTGLTLDDRKNCCLWQNHFPRGLEITRMICSS
jgi:hypothetical protein